MQPPRLDVRRQLADAEERRSGVRQGAGDALALFLPYVRRLATEARWHSTGCRRAEVSTFLLHKTMEK